MKYLLVSMDTEIKHDESNMKSSLWFNIIEFVSSKMFTHLINLLSIGLMSRNFLTKLRFFSPALQSSDARVSNCKKHFEAITGYFADNIYTGICGFVGCDIFSTDKFRQKDTVA